MNNEAAYARFGLLRHKKRKIFCKCIREESIVKIKGEIFRYIYILWLGSSSGSMPQAGKLVFTLCCSDL